MVALAAEIAKIARQGSPVMRRIVHAFALAAVAGLAASAEAQPGPPGQPAKDNANPCRDEVSAALQKLRKSSWFRMTTSMITESGPMSMQVDYVLPDKMHQQVILQATQHASEIILIGDQGWSKEGADAWKPLQNDVIQELKSQMQENVVQQQADIGNYSCKGRTEFEGKDVFSYKLEDQPEKDSTAPKNEAFRMFYVDAVTGLPVSNALLVPGREARPIFKAVYAYPLDIKIDPPKNASGE